jgi:flavin-binding protein dodecin
MVVQMHFGDGSFKEIEVESSEPDEAIQEARDWVSDNAWFEVMDEEGLKVLAEERLPT